MGEVALIMGEEGEGDRIISMISSKLMIFSDEDRDRMDFLPAGMLP